MLKVDWQICQILSEQLKKIALNEDWELMRSWFRYWDTEEERNFKVLLWGRFFLKTYFRDTTPDFHLDLIQRFFSKQNEYTAAPRGFSKTTIIQLCIAFSVAHNLDNFIVVIEKSFTEATEVLSAVRDEFANNKSIIQVYGSLIKKSEAGVFDDKNKDSQGDLFINGVRLRAKGFDSPIRGLKSKEWRPTRIILDDVESDSHINSFEQRDKYKDNFIKGIIPAVDIDGCVKVFGTILHYDSLLNVLIKQHNGIIYRAYDKTDPSNTLLWPSRWNLEAIEKKKEQMMLEGKGSAKFYQEFLNDPVSDENRVFHWHWLQKEFVDSDIKFKSVNRYATIDVAESKQEGSDYTAVSVVDWDFENNWYLQFVKRQRLDILGLIDLIFYIWKEYKPAVIGVEKKAFEDQIQPLLKVKSNELGVYPIVVELKHHGKAKEDRIKGALQGRFEAGKIFFKTNSNDDQKILKSELFDFPSAVNDDMVDSLAYIENVGKRPYKAGKEEQLKTIAQELQEYRKSKVDNLSFLHNI